MLKRLTSAEDAEWFGRLTIQLFTLSGTAFQDPKEHEQFKRLQMSLVEILRECRDAQLELAALVDLHTREVEAGKGGIDVINGHVSVENDIEPRLNRLFKDFFSKARTALYRLFGQRNAAESVTFFLLGRSISFAQVKDDAKFDEDAANFLHAVPGAKAQALMDIIRGDRGAWMSILIGTRDVMIHGMGCPQLKMTYRIVDGKVRAFFPTISAQELRGYLDLLWVNLYQAVEEVVLLCIAIRLPESIVPCRIPDDRVDPNLRFRWCFARRVDRAQDP